MPPITSEALREHAAGRQLNPAYIDYQQERRHYWDNFAESLDRWQWIRGFYQRSLATIYRSLIPPGMRVLEIGSCQGDLLASLKPSRGVGIDFSERMIERSRARYPGLDFIHADALEFLPAEKFDFIILSDVANDLWDVQTALEMAGACCEPSTRLILNVYSRLWELPRRFAEMLGLAKPQLTQNWLTREDVSNLLYLSGFETIRQFSEIMLPVQAPGLDVLCNHYLVKLGLFSWMGLANFIVARPQPGNRANPSLS